MYYLSTDAIFGMIAVVTLFVIREEAVVLLISAK